MFKSDNRKLKSNGIEPTELRGCHWLLMVRVLIVFLMIQTGNALSQNDHEVTYAYAPARWYTPICLIDDWQKSLVDQQGRLVYDFGPGPYARPKTTLSVEMVDATGYCTRQTLLQARIPIVLTEHIDGDRRWRQTAFSLIPEDPQKRPSRLSADSSFIRYQGLVGSPAWAPAHKERDPAFTSAAWGTGRSIRYDVKVPVNAKRRVALGFIDVYRKGRIKRLMDLVVEGDSIKTVDLIKTGGRNTPQVFFFNGHDENSDGWLQIEVTASSAGQDPNVLLSAIWVFKPDIKITAEEVISGKATSLAQPYINAGMELFRQGIVRRDVLRTEIIGTRGALHLRLNTLRPLEVDKKNGTLLFKQSPFIITDPGFSKAVQTHDGWLLSFADNTRLVDVMVIHGYPDAARQFPDILEAEQNTISWWQQAELPWNRLIVPDDEIQNLIDGGIRTLYQIREAVDGYKQFQPGATIYRGLWYGDAMWAAETVAMLDDGKATRQVLEAMLLHQQPSGRAVVMKPPLLHRETAHLIYSMCRYARLHQDWAWLEAHWTELDNAMQHLFDLRQQTRMDSTALYFNLIPPGLTDGGVAGIGASYGSVFWNLIAMAEAVHAANAMQRPERERWKAEYRDFKNAFYTAVERDKRRDEQGHLFLPMKMHFEPDRDLPQRGQWGMLHSIYIGHFFEKSDPLVMGTLNMLDSRTAENLVVSTGWLNGGVWPIFDAHRALAYNWIAEPDKAEKLLYAFANHASPTLVWGEEQMPKNGGDRVTGDIPHTVGNLQVIRVVRNMLMLERDTRLELLAGLPQTWIKADAHLAVLALPTCFGPVTLKFDIDPDGQRAILWIKTPKPQIEATSVHLYLDRFIKAGFSLDANGNRLKNRIKVPWNHLYRMELQKP